VRAYALAEIGGRMAVEVFVRSEDAFDALDDAVTDEPRWLPTLFVVPIELDERDMCAN
jgi:hypothetical protein